MPSITQTVNKAAMLIKPHHVEIRDIGIPTIKANEVLVQVRVNGLCGSDLHMYRHGGIGKAVVTQPMVLGHESAGVVYQLGSEVRGLKIGQKVAIEPGRPCKSCSNCKTGRTNLCYNLRHCCVPPDHGSLSQFYATTPEFLVPIPEGISWEEAGCIQPLAVAIQLAKRANFTVGQTLAVFGCGPLGLLIMAVAKACGISRIIAFNRSQARADFAANYLADHAFVTPPQLEGEDYATWAERVKKDCLEEAGLDPNGVDVAVEVSGAEACVHLGMGMLRLGGTYVQAGLGRPVTSFPTLLLAVKEITAVGTIRYTAGCFEAAIDLLAQGKIDIKPLITKSFPLEQIEDALNAVIEGKEMKVVVTNY